MAILCKSLGLLFIMTPRTGCTAVGTLLRERFDGRWLPADDVRSARGRIVVDKKHGTLAQLRRHGLLATTDANALLKCATVRNPYDSLFSLYWKRRQTTDAELTDPSSWMYGRRDVRAEVRRCRALSFDAWLRRRLRPAAPIATLGLRRFSMFRQFTDGMDAILRFEHLEDDLNDVLGRLGVTERVTIPRVNPTRGRDPDFRRHYSGAARRLVARVFAEDFRRYGYGA